ncbi:MAG TPA: hypothetical protein VFB12_28930, partial [Ktedonobacteraceae bacterium]|nr:hypothetical protein [Ktedonobacteraceae bacterium]
MMNKKPPYTHLLKNLFHEQTSEIIPLLWPEYRVEEVLEIEIPALKSTSIEGPPEPLTEGIVGLALPGATIVGAYETELIEHTGNFERIYRVQNPETNQQFYFLIEVQTERDDEDLPLRLLRNFARANISLKDMEDEDSEDGDYEDEDSEESVEEKPEGTHRPTYIYPVVLCPFPQAMPAHIRDEFRGQVMLEFKFKVLGLWEKDARELLNSQISAIYFLLPAMKNADAFLLRLAIEQLAQRFQDNPQELGRHLTGLNIMMQQSETMPQEEKLA